MAGDGQRPVDRRRHHELHRKVRAENLLIYGSGRLSETLRAAGLIDEYRLLICPVVLGEGRRLFTDGTPTEFTVADNRTAPSGMVLLTLTKT